MEPAFDIYSAQVRMAGGVPKFIPLRQQPVETLSNANDVFHLDMDELKSSITPQTKVLVINTPHNPTGKMFSKNELEQIAAIVELNPQLTVIADEVYEYIVFDKNKSPHVHFASLPGMYERTLTLSSSGKTFSCTGWKVGWAVGM
jgi:aspartate/methionine/tyrosine aminotransferase